MGATLHQPDLRRKLKVRMRPDLIINEQRYRGQRFFIVKDPVSLRYFRFREEELFLLQQLDGNRMLDDVRHEFVEKFRPQRISIRELETFVKQLLQAGVATVDTPQLGRRLYERYKQRRNDKIKQTLMNIMYLKVPLFDPERLLSAMMPYARILFTLTFFALMIGLWTSAALLVLVNWDTFVSKLPSYHEFFTWRYILYFWTTLAVVKIMHEFGHGLSCKRFGGEVHEMGLLILVLTPCLYCNVTDAWMLPNKWHRAIIGAAGIYVELILASLFVWVWWYSEPGLLNTISLSIVFVCSVSTVVFNGNPLLRYDGYYILSDLMEIPNLRERSNKFLGNFASKVFFGSEAIADPYAPKQRQWFFVAYAIAAYVYRWVVAVGILWFLYNFLKPYKLGSISAMIAMAAAVSLVVVPIYQIVKLLRSRWREMKVSKTRLVVSMTLAVLLLAGILFTPLPMWIDVPFIIQPRDATPIFVRTPGVLESLEVKDGDVVNGGARLAVLGNPELRKQYQQLELDRKQQENASDAFLFINEPGRAAEASVQELYLQQQLDNMKQQMQSLTIIVPRSARGTAFLPPKEREIGRLFQAGERFCEIGDPRNLEAYLVVQHSDTSLLNKGQRVSIKLSGHVGRILEGRVEDMPRAEIEELPPALSNKRGGEVQTTASGEGAQQREIPAFTSYAYRVPLTNDDGKLAPGNRGVARVDIGYRSIYWRVKRYLQQTFHFRM